MKRLIMLPLIVAAALFVQGCKEETAGEKLDKAVEQTKDASKDAANKTGEALKKAGDKVQDATK